MPQLPGLVAPSRYDTLLRRAHGASQLRTLRELGAAVECLSAERLLVLVLEDLHWSDPSTVSALAMLARRGERARLLIIGTFRPEEINTGNHPLRTLLSELKPHNHCAELKPSAWGAKEIATYLGTHALNGGHVRVAGSHVIVRLLEQRTGSNPLFVAAMVDNLCNSGALTVDASGWRLAAGAARVHHPLPCGSRCEFIRTFRAGPWRPVWVLMCA